MSCIDFIIDDIKSFSNEIAIVTDGKEYTYPLNTSFIK